MKREIKFRGRLFNNKWVYGGISVFEGETTIFDANCVVNTAYDVDPETVGQFMGLKDKNDVEIYEDDILLTDSGIGFVVWNGLSFAIESPGSEAIDYERLDFYEKCEIIGNLHDNPELIKP
ncbi:YopX family protein [Flavobacterium anhuiense]|uniref:YopX family protein n=1 Tax=Flavobacterium anhuiense TaxID=459526 RepID=UPI0020275C22|nr:YopX family protein [Flavobacterium anhuiense]URM37165.1 YopX family protein [Flavobacterium anhuiense]